MDYLFVCIRMLRAYNREGVQRLGRLLLYKGEKFKWSTDYLLVFTSDPETCVGVSDFSGAFPSFFPGFILISLKFKYFI